MVTIVDPHIKRDPDYHVHSVSVSLLNIYIPHPKISQIFISLYCSPPSPPRPYPIVPQEAEASQRYVKRSDGSTSYDGWCWPGSSSWIDFLDPANREWWADMLSPTKYLVVDEFCIWADLFPNKRLC